MGLGSGWPNPDLLEGGLGQREHGLVDRHRADGARSLHALLDRSHGRPALARRLVGVEVEGACAQLRVRVRVRVRIRVRGLG